MADEANFPHLSRGLRGLGEPKAGMGVKDEEELQEGPEREGP